MIIRTAPPRELFVPRGEARDPVRDEELQIWVMNSDSRAIDFFLSPRFPDHLVLQDLRVIGYYANALGELLTQDELLRVSLKLGATLQRLQADGSELALDILRTTLFLLRKCTFCSKQQKEMFACKECPYVFYCGPECQRADWQLHKLMCNKYSNVRYTEDGLLVGNWIAYQMAHYNKEHKYKNLDLHVVHGSLGFGRDWFEFGGEDFRLFHEFVTPHSVDAHSWLEDAEGRVYDIVQPMFLSVARMRSIELPGLKPFNAIQGMTKEKLEQEHNLVYIPAPKEVIPLLDAILAKRKTDGL